MKHCILLPLLAFFLSLAATHFSYATPAAAPIAANSESVQSTSFKPLAGGLLASLLLKEPFHQLRFADILLLVLVTGSLIFLLKRRSDRLKRYLTPRPEPRIDDDTLESLSEVIQQDITATPPPSPAANDKTIPFRLGFKPKNKPAPKPETSNNEANHPLSDKATPLETATDDIAPYYEQFDLPEDLQPELFLEQAKELFRRLQQAWLAGDQQTLKHYTTPELFDRLRTSIPAQPNPSSIELLTIFADITSASNLGDLTMISVKFHGWSKAKTNKDVETYCEVWHLENLKQDSQWLITGIQPVSGNLKFNKDSDSGQLSKEEINS